MKNIDLLADAVKADAPAAAAAPAADPNQIAGDLIDKIAVRVVELLAQQTTDPEPEPDPEPEAGGDTDDAGQSGQMD